jgi:DNA adenine methylase
VRVAEKDQAALPSARLTKIVRPIAMPRSMTTLTALIAETLPPPVFAPPQLEAYPRLSPFLKWPGGKTQELPAIAAGAPLLTGRFIDPFVGGGSVLLAAPAFVPALVNDACRDLVELYASAASSEPAFRQAIDGMASAWDGMTDLAPFYAELAHSFASYSPAATVAALDEQAGRLDALLESAGPELATSLTGRAAHELPAKFERMRRLEVQHDQRLSPPDLLANVEGAVRSSFYMSVRARYNGARLADQWGAVRSVDFLFLREFAYASMFRFNARNEFNVPYGGISYNRKSMGAKARLLFGDEMLARLVNTQFDSRDFEPFLAAAELTPDDFVFVDPPYDSDFSAYDNRPFDGADQVRLERTLARVPARVMVVIKDAPAIRALYSADRWHVSEAPKTYMWTIKSRNERSATHLTITNYPSVDSRE